MNTAALSRVNTLTFDIFGTVLNLTESLVLPTDEFLAAHSATIDGATFWPQWRARQRIEQYQDNILMLGHSGYLETCRRAFVYTLKSNGIAFEESAVAEFMNVYENLQPYEDAVDGLKQLGEQYSLVALSNGEQHYLEHLAVNNIGIEFDAVISVEKVGAFKPHPSVYRTAARLLEKEPGDIMMVAAHSFDIMGARACGYRGAYVNRYGLPTEDSPYQPDFEVNDFIQLADKLRA